MGKERKNPAAAARKGDGRWTGVVWRLWCLLPGRPAAAARDGDVVCGSLCDAVGVPFLLVAVTAFRVAREEPVGRRHVEWTHRQALAWPRSGLLCPSPPSSGERARVVVVASERAALAWTVPGP